ncbi:MULTISPECIES: DUF2939 domain-containing protein [Burkholderia]|uniref:DUF2939 domain-containing protein n=1 Tax=Burkholderia TaxID=32008 RepID=UPI000841846A|nr:MULTISPECIES: DUF2939 domain-containing protein [unclassified Burkholderia]AOK29850.1 hypothetical protein AQ611_10875 [Burkholderia sp. Bp7605]
MSAIAHPQRRVLKPLFIIAMFVIAVAMIVYGYASPYLALRQIKQAIDARDAHAISQYVDFPALRSSLKQQLTNELMQRIEARQRDNPLAIIGALVGSALVGPLVDAYATPEGVAALMSGLPPRAQPGERPPELNPAGSEPSTAAATGPGAAPPLNNGGVSSSVSGAATDTTTQTAPPASDAPPNLAPRTSASYRGVDEFVVIYRRNNSNAHYAAIFHRSGLFGWKLSAIDLHEHDD